MVILPILIIKIINGETDEDGLYVNTAIACYRWTRHLRQAMLSGQRLQVGTYRQIALSKQRTTVTRLVFDSGRSVTDSYIMYVALVDPVTMPALLSRPQFFVILKKTTPLWRFNAGASRPGSSPEIQISRRVGSTKK